MPEQPLPLTLDSLIAQLQEFRKTLPGDTEIWGVDTTLYLVQQISNPEDDELPDVIEIS